MVVVGTAQRRHQNFVSRTQTQSLIRITERGQMPGFISVVSIGRVRKNGPTIRRDRTAQLHNTLRSQGPGFFRRPQACKRVFPTPSRTTGADVHNKYPHSFHKTFLHTYKKAIIKEITLFHWKNYKWRPIPHQNQCKK